MTAASLVRPATQAPIPVRAPAYLPRLTASSSSTFMLVFLHQLRRQSLQIISTVSTYGWIGVGFYSVFRVLDIKLIAPRTRGAGQISGVSMALSSAISTIPADDILFASYNLSITKFFQVSQSSWLCLAVNDYLGHWLQRLQHFTNYIHRAHICNLCSELQVYLFIPVAFVRTKNLEREGSGEIFWRQLEFVISWAGAILYLARRTTPGDLGSSVPAPKSTLLSLADRRRANQAADLRPFCRRGRCGCAGEWPEHQRRSAGGPSCCPICAITWRPGLCSTRPILSR